MTLEHIGVLYTHTAMVRLEGREMNYALIATGVAYLVAGLGCVLITGCALISIRDDIIVIRQVRALNRKRQA